MSVMMTRRRSLVTLAGLASGFLVSAGLGLPGSVSAQSGSPTKSGVKAKSKAAAKKGQMKWESLTPEQQEQAKTKLQAGAEKANEKWNSLTPEQQQEMIGKGQAGAQRARKKWQSLPK